MHTKMSSKLFSIHRLLSIIHTLLLLGMEGAKYIDCLFVCGGPCSGPSLGGLGSSMRSAKHIRKLGDGVATRKRMTCRTVDKYAVPYVLARAPVARVPPHWPGSQPEKRPCFSKIAGQTRRLI